MSTLYDLHLLPNCGCVSRNSVVFILASDYIGNIFYTQRAMLHIWSLLSSPLLPLAVFLNPEATQSNLRVLAL